MTTPTSVDEYLAGLPVDSRRQLELVRQAILDALPQAQERISYGMPTVTLDGRAVLHYSAWKKHIGVYPVPTGDAEFDARIAPYRDAKSTARFPLDEPMPVDLIARMAQFSAVR